MVCALSLSLSLSLSPLFSPPCFVLRPCSCHLHRPGLSPHLLFEHLFADNLVALLFAVFFLVLSIRPPLTRSTPFRNTGQSTLLPYSFPCFVGLPLSAFPTFFEFFKLGEEKWPFGFWNRFFDFFWSSLLPFSVLYSFHCTPQTGTAGVFPSLSAMLCGALPAGVYTNITPTLTT